MKRIAMMEGARRLLEVCAGTRPGERVLVATDVSMPLSVSQALFSAALNLGAIPVLAVMGFPMGEEPPEPVAAAMLSSDVILAPTSRSLYHTKACREACERGARLLAITECLEDTLMKGGIMADFRGLEPVVQRAAGILAKGSWIRITTPAGTDISASIEGRPGNANTGVCQRPGMRMGVPDIEVNSPPIETTTQGQLVIDASIGQIGLLSQPVVVEIDGGRAVSIQGGPEAKAMKEVLDKTGDPASYVVAELAVGLNPEASVVGRIIEDEGAYLTGHVGFGDNIGHGGASKAPIHLDVVFWHPTVEVDGQVIFKEGLIAFQ
ncbi:MAG: leucyl aminopeptidase [Bacillota bacterium]